MSSSMKAAIHFGPCHLANLEVHKNTNFEEIQSLFNITQKLVLELSEEILVVNTIDSAFPSWTRSVLSRDQVIQWTQAKVLVYSDSVLCLVKGMIAKVQLKDGKVKWENSKCLLLMKNCLESMEKQLNSSGIFSEDLRHRRFFKKSRMIHKSGTLNLRKFTHWINLEFRKS